MADIDTNSSTDDIYKVMLERAMPYLDTRFNDIHTPIAYELARQLLASYPDADEAIVLAAITLHDVGWKMIPEELQLEAFGPKMTNFELRRVHETEGARIAAEILSGLDFDPAKIREVVEIIDGHDSRETPISLNDTLVKDADRLWRFTPVGMEIDSRRFGFQLDEYVVFLSEQIDKWLYTPAARLIARQSVTNRDA